MDFEGADIPLSYVTLSKKYFDEGNYTEAYEVQKKALVEDGKNVNIWHDLSWQALFANKPKEAIIAAQKALSLRSYFKKVESKLALGYLLDNQWAAAEKIYLKWKGKRLPNHASLSDGVFLKDIQALEAAGIQHDDFAKVKALFKK